MRAASRSTLMTIPRCSGTSDAENPGCSLTIIPHILQGAVAMKSYHAVLVLVLALVFFSCQREGGVVSTPNASSPVKAGPMSTESIVPLPQSVVLSGFTVQYNGRTEAGGQTTFSYT